MLSPPDRYPTLATFDEQKHMKTRDAIVAQVAHLIRGTRKLFTSPTQFKLFLGIESEGYATIGLNLSPATEAFRYTGVDMCPGKTKGCAGACLFQSGHNNLQMASIARIARTILWVHARATFLRKATLEIRRYQNWARNKGLRLAIRPNLLSDDTRLAEFIQCIASDSTTVYDYTAIRSAMDLTDGVHRTYSRKEGRDAETVEVLRAGHPVAVVFAGPLPTTWEGYPVINGDKHDLRFIDACGAVVVGLKVKGVKNATKERAIASGFAIAS